MRKRKYTRITKTLAFLVLVSLIMFLTVTSASASTDKDYQDGYKIGFKIGLKVGQKAGNEDYLKYGHEGVLKKIPGIKVKNDWTESYKKGIKKGFKKGFIYAYNKARFKCLETTEK